MEILKMSVGYFEYISGNNQHYGVPIIIAEHCEFVNGQYENGFFATKKTNHYEMGPAAVYYSVTSMQQKPNLFRA